MSASLLAKYTSSDASGPGVLTGTAGALLTLLDACLVNGYSGHAAAGWTKPIANSGNIGCYKQGAGSGLNLVVNDNTFLTAKEAIATGWESLASIAAPVGTGTGQFPTPAQSLTNGHVVYRKSNTADGTGRAWQLFADASTFYLFVVTGDSASNYMRCCFGDLFSFVGASDAYRCFIQGRDADNSFSDARNNRDDFMICPANGVPLTSSIGGGWYMPRSFGGAGISIGVSPLWQMAWAASLNTTNVYAVFNGAIQVPNGPDNSYYLSPIVVYEHAVAALRGRMRGLYAMGHSSASFADGQTFSGAGDYAGKSFQVIKGGMNGGYWVIETSATVETN